MSVVKLLLHLLLVLPRLADAGLAGVSTHTVMLPALQGVLPVMGRDSGTTGVSMTLVIVMKRFHSISPLGLGTTNQ